MLRAKLICQIGLCIIIGYLTWKNHCRLNDLEFQNKQIWYSISGLQLNENKQNEEFEEFKVLTDMQLQQLQVTGSRHEQN